MRAHVYWWLVLLAPAQAFLAQTPPVFRADVHLVPVDVTATGSQNALVTDLRLQDFTVLEDGKPQKLANLDLERPDDAVPATQPDAASAPPVTGGAGTEPAGSLHDRRLIVLFFDWTSMPPNYLQPPNGLPFSTAGNAQAAVEWSENFVRNQMLPADRVAIATFGDDLEVEQDFTARRDSLQRSLAALDDEAKRGYAPGGGIAGGSLIALQQLCLHLAPIPGKKFVIVFSSGLYGLNSDLDTAVAAANRANALLFPWDAKGLVAPAPGAGMPSPAELFESQQFMSALATGSGGAALFDGNNIGALVAAVHQAGTYYVLSYYSANPVMDGRRRRVTVRVDRPGVRLDYRDFYYAQRDFGHMDAAQRKQRLAAECGSGGTEQTLNVAANGRNDVPGRLAVTVHYLPGSDATAMVMVEDAAGKTVANATADGSSGTYTAAFVLPPGDYAVGAAVQDDASGNIGATRFSATVAAPGR